MGKPRIELVAKDGERVKRKRSPRRTLVDVAPDPKPTEVDPGPPLSKGEVEFLRWVVRETIKRMNEEPKTEGDVA